MLQRLSRFGDRAWEQINAQKSPDLSQNGFALVCRLIPEHGHRNEFSFPETKPRPVHGAAFTVLADFNLNG
jgi:hypothetical protein